MRFILIISVIIFLSQSELQFVSSEALKCSFSTGSWQYAISMYYCEVHNNNIFISKSSVTVTSIEGKHIGDRSNKHVVGISFNTLPNVNYMPLHLNYFFTNLIAIQIYNSSLLEIHQSDLKVFPNLKYLYLCCNKLEIIEAELFKYNPQLQLIWLQKNRIYHIDPFVFTFLHQLQVLWLDGNNCSKSFGDVNNSGEVEKVVKRIEDEGCSNYRYTSFQIYEKIEKESKVTQEKVEKLTSIFMKIIDENNNVKVKLEEIDKKLKTK
ncbi:hypothetical protein PVAND_014385 [Polypedilum vanderplanki]|uniref:Uncharacterized protein n=1 Tax=Polypedilum vanderplanki TaxID=319348 RepID=A0A9J6B9L1_POLVA|nr:hypothetical protein PVAND_014385 [Polypedilum vanderplanki]